ncbi:MAG: VOC family protein [Polyangiaceae bacterium]
MTSFNHGMFVWRELMTPDVDAALRFYGETFGWKTKGMPMPHGGTYHLLNAGETGVGGMMQCPDDMKTMPPFWSSYVSVPDVDAACEKAKASGGKVAFGPMNLENVGRMAMILDPQGACFWAFKSAQGDGERSRPGAGHFCWEQLNTTDTGAAKKFYTDVLGWKSQGFGQGMETFGVGPRMEDQAGSLMTAPPGVPAHWLTYVAVDKLGDACARVTRAKGTVVMERLEIPTVGAIAVIKDPQGAFLGLFESTM